MMITITDQAPLSFVQHVLQSHHRPLQRRPCDNGLLQPPRTATVLRYAIPQNSKNNNDNDNSNNDDDDSDPLVNAMIQLQYTPEQRTTIITQLQTVGLWNTDTSNTTITTPSMTLRTLMRDYLLPHHNSDDNALSSSTISTVLIQDFQLSPLVAHQTRTALLYLHQQQQQQEEEQSFVAANNDAELQPQQAVPTTNKDRIRMDTTGTTTKGPKQTLSDPLQKDESQEEDDNISTPSWEQRYKSTIVRPIAQRRLAMCRPSITRTTSTTTGTSRNNNNSKNHNMFAYSLQPIEDYPISQQELQEFYHFMTLPSTDSQDETPIRPATANIYIRHAKLFLGWYWSIHLPTMIQPNNNNNYTNDTNRKKELLSLYVIFPTKDKVHANSILQYILWLRTTRYIAVSYEANLLRGLCKLLKFRYRKESVHESDNTEVSGMKSNSNDDTTPTSFNDIPVIRELRKLHRDANRRQAVAPRVSNEDQKWLSWPDYIQVVQRTKDDLSLEIQSYETSPTMMKISKNPKDQRILDIHRRRIAVLYQKYLILSFFANIPDRQRTIRELEMGRSLVRDNVNHQWCIKHTPDDYKTGKTYGERPPLQLPTSLTNDIDDFIAHWRPALVSPNAKPTQYLFLGPRTGTPLTSDSVYQTVSKTCYYYMGKRTNPHLLRDMIVTHVRESSSVTEQQLEALALFMGHSAAIQRKSYDRRTLTKKVAPAIALMEQVNADSRTRKE
jgi:hypothetical protein